MIPKNLALPSLGDKWEKMVINEFFYYQKVTFETMTVIYNYNATIGFRILL